ncbi:MAG: hypothetical protein OER80_13465 [Gammaproteobacteria bacterium]|nr:hypothetical protein [Gammaproteobacteria bacterium]MDH3767115.1 hypothetical protein [Gammaproteobacteria bacterium]
MGKVLSIFMLIVPLVAFAGHGDVIEVQLTEDCSVAEYVKIKDDFNEQWGKKNGYLSEVFVPVQSDNLISLYWVGRTANAAAFGKAWDQWRNDLGDANSVASKLWARFQACSKNMSRTGYDVL